MSSVPAALVTAAGSSSSSSSSPSLVPSRRWVVQKQSPFPKVSLSRVLGHTIAAPNALAYNPSKPSEIAYCAGSTIVLYDQRSHAQSHFFVGRRGRQFQCVSFSEDGRWLVAGEKGKNAAALVWDCQTGERSGIIIGQVNTVTHAKFSPFKVYLLIVSEVPSDAEASPGAAIGESLVRSNVALWRSSDNQCVWSHTFASSEFRDVRESGAGAAAAAPSTSRSMGPAARMITAVDWSADGLHFVIGGARFLQYYYIRPLSSSSASPAQIVASDIPALVSIEKHAAKLGVHDEAEFVALASGSGALIMYTFALSAKGMLCAFALKERKKKGASSEGTSEPGETSSREESVSTSREGYTTSSGALPPNKRWEIEKWVDLRLESATSLSFAAGVLAMGGADSKVRVFEASKLEHLATLPKPAPLLSTASEKEVGKRRYPAAVCVALCPDTNKLSVTYSDRAWVIWDIQNPKKRACTPFRAWQAHAAAVWDIAFLSTPRTSAGTVQKNFEDSDFDSEEEENAKSTKRGRFPAGTFVTCSADSSIRFWHADQGPGQSTNVASAPSSLFHSHAKDSNSQWAGDVLASIYVHGTTEDGTSDATTIVQPVGGIRCLKFIPPRSSSPGAAAPGSLASYTHGLLATGDQAGNVRLHNLTDLQQLTSLSAHDREVRALDFLEPPPVSAAYSTKPNGTPIADLSSLPLLISGSRDSLVHIYNLHTPASPKIFTPEVVHNAAVTAVRITTIAPSITGSATANGSSASLPKVLFISCGTDRSLSIRTLSSLPSASVRTDSTEGMIAGAEEPIVFKDSALHDLTLHPTRKFLALLCTNTQKKTQAQQMAGKTGGNTATMASKPVNCLVRLIDLNTLRESRCYSIQTSGGGDPVRLVLDPSGLFLAISFTDKSILLLDWYSGQVLSSFYGHSQVSTGLVFSPDCKWLLSTGTEGCVMMWKLDADLTKAMLARRKELEPKASTEQRKDGPGGANARSSALDYLDTDPEEEEETSAGEEEVGKAEPLSSIPPPPAQLTSSVELIASAAAAAPGGPAFKLAPPRSLPSWARSTVVSPDGGAIESGSLLGPKSRWAARVEVNPATGQPIVPVKETGKVYGTMGTIGVDTMLLEGREGAEAAAAGTAASENKEIEEEIEIEIDGEGGEEDEEIEAESYVDAGQHKLEAAGSAVDESAPAEPPSNFLRSSLTSQFFQKLRSEGKLTTGSPAATVASRGAFRLPPSLQQREAQTTTEISQVREQLRNMGVLERRDGNIRSAAEPGVSVSGSGSAEGSFLPKLTQSSELVPSTAPAEKIPFSDELHLPSLPAAATQPIPSVSPASSVVLSEGSSKSTSQRLTGSRAEGESQPGSPLKTSSPAVSFPSLQPAPRSPPPPMAAVPPSGQPSAPSTAPTSVHKSMAFLPSARQSLQVHRSTIEQFQASLHDLLESFAEVKQAQMKMRPHTAAGAQDLTTMAGAEVPSVSVSFSLGSRPSVAVIPVLPSTESDGSSSSTAALLTSGDAHVRGSVSIPSAAEVLDGANQQNTDIDKLAAVYEQQLKGMQAVLAQLLPTSHQETPPPPPIPTTDSSRPPPTSSSPASVAVGSHVAVPQGGTAATQGVGSPTVGGPDPFANMSATQANLLQSMEFGMQQQSHLYDRMSDRLADMVLRKLEAKVAMGGTGALSTTQQLALGLTLSGNPQQQASALAAGQLPQKPFSAAAPEDKREE